MKRLGLTGIAALAAMAALVAPGSGGAAAGDQIDSSKVHARFGLGRPADGPFPADWYTVEDASNLTGVRVSLPLPDCSIDRSECEDIGVLNELDGFNPQPRVSVPFDGAIDLATTTSDSVFLLDIDRGRRVRIDQLVWDPATTTLHFESDELLRQHSSYAVIVTRAVHDSEGSAIKTTPAFREFLEAPCADERECDYQQAVREALAAAERLGTPAGSVASASVFTTLSSTAVMEKIRDQIKATTPEPIDFRLGAGGGRTAFAIAEVWFDRQTRVDGPLSPVRLDLAPLGVVPGAVGQIAYGRFASADYQAGPGVLPVIGTRTGTPAVQRVNKLSCTLVLPSGFGFGEQSKLRVRLTDGSEVTFLSGGRGIDQDGDGQIAAREGDRPEAPHTILWERDGLRQTAADLLQLVRQVEVGVDVDGDAAIDLDPARVYYAGFSLGANYGALAATVDPRCAL